MIQTHTDTRHLQSPEASSLGDLAASAIERVVSRALEAGSSSAVCLRELAQVSFQKACISKRLAIGGHEEEDEMLVLSSV